MRSPGPDFAVSQHAPAVSDKLIALAKSGKVTLLPHMGSATHEGRADMGEKVIINIKTFMDGHRPPDRVLPKHALMRQRTGSGDRGVDEFLTAS